VNARCVLANGAWLASSLPAAIAFVRNVDRVREVQKELLLRILRRNAETQFGRAHGFASIRNVREYQERIPVRTFDEAAELRGDPRAFASSPITHYESTSGSSGASKRIPYTRELRAEIGRAVAPWIAGLAAAHPGAFAGEAYWSVSPVMSDETGVAADEEHLGPLRARLVRAVQAVPREVRFIRELESFRRATLLHLLRRRTLSLMSVWHPSFLLLLLGSLREVASESDDRRVREALRETDDAELHRRIWPHLRVISCWSDANATRDAAALARLFPHVTLQPKGLLATEGVVSIPLGDGEAPALAYRSHFFELRSVQSGVVVPASEGEIGQRYQVLLTTSGGLYRYDTEDLVDVVGYRERCPLLRFIGRAHHVSDHYGEKLHEVFVRERLEQTLDAHGVAASFAMLACEERAYALFLESEATDAALLDVARGFETELRENVHYDYCRRVGQLGALALFRVAGGGSKTFLCHSSQRLGQVKLSTLDRRRGWSDLFRGNWISSG
jgi:hypothetical protein